MSHFMSHDNSDKDQPKRERTWKTLQQDLQKALDSWDGLSKKTEKGPNSPAEEQLEDMKKLLAELQKRLKDF